MGAGVGDVVLGYMPTAVEIAGVMCHARELWLFGEFLLQCLAPEPWQRDPLEPSQRFD